MMITYREFIGLNKGVLEIDFYLARNIVKLLGLTEDRLLFYTIIACSESVREGHSCLKLSEWANQRRWQLDSQSNSTVDLPIIEPNQNGDLFVGGGSTPTNESGFHFPDISFWQGHLSSLPLSNDAHPVVYENDRFYLRRYWQFETEVVNGIHQYSQTIPFETAKAIETLDTLFLSASDIDWQKVSVANSLGKQLSVITGGPGTGKTTTVTKLLLALCTVYAKAFHIKLVAPTGKAAQRLTESISAAKVALANNPKIPSVYLDSIPEEASTIYRLLGVIPNNSQFRFNKDRRLSLDIVLVDEVSMVDVGLMAKLFRALPDHARIIMLGDSNQLPSVATGSVLADIAPLPHPGYSPGNMTMIKALTGYSLESATSTPADYLTSLRKSYRFSHDGGIGTLAGHVINGEAKPSWTMLSKGGDEVTLADEQDFTGWISGLENRHYRALGMQACVDDALALFSKFRILAPTRVGDRGVEAVNRLIDTSIKRTRGVSITTELYHGCPILITENDYDNELFNGDVGMVWNHDGRLQAAFYEASGTLRWVSLQRVPRHEKVYAMTIHKTQGSEFEHVAMTMPEHDSKILSRELIYTGITRAKNQLEIYSGEAVWRNAVGSRVSRNSGLYEKLFLDEA